MRFSHIAGDAALDLLNTVEWRLGAEERVDDLRGYDDVLAWCAEAGLLDAREVTRLAAQAQEAQAPARRELESVVALREAAYATLLDDDASAARVLGEGYREAVAAAQLAPTDDGWGWRDDRVTLATPRHRIARALIALLGRPDLDRLHQCEDAKCGWVYLDTSPRRNRRWCVSSDCGDRNRARRYYARQQAKRG